MRGILSHAGYLPYRRLDRSTIAAVAGTGGGMGTRAVASYDEDTTTMAVDAARLVLRAGPAVAPAALYFSTTAPAYADKTNATAVHAALRLPQGVVAADYGGAVRSGVAALRLALVAPEPALVVTADIRIGLPGGPDEASGGDGASALLVGDDTDGPVLAEFLGSASATEEFLDRWRTPGDVRSKVWEERFGEGRYLDLGEQAFASALKATGLGPEDVTDLIVTSTHGRAATAVARRLGRSGTNLVDDLAARVGHTGAAHPGLLLASVLESAGPDRVVALVSLADGADVLVLRTTRHVTTYRPARPVAEQVDGGPLPYGKYLAWRGLLGIEPPRRPEPARVSATAAFRSTDWKFGFVGSRSVETGAITMPPAVAGGGGELEPVPMAGARGTVATFTIDRLAYSPSPPVVFAVVDFDGGGRLPLELTDVDADELAIGDRVEPTFRRLSTTDGIHNYFWKARPVRG
ncbi:MAG: OB-fold domain-containing protein [Acidimicrobiales bacterium]